MPTTNINILAAGMDCKPEFVSILKNFGYTRISETDDAVLTWNFLKKHPVEIVFADWKLSQFDGLVLMKLMLADENLRKTPVILLSSKVNREMVINAGHAGISAILLKPFDLKKIKKKIAELFDSEDKQKDIKAEGLIESGREFMRKGEHKEALKEFYKIIELYENPEIYYNIGYIKAAQQRYDESIVAFRKAINIDKKFAEAYKALGEVYSKTGQQEKAEEMMQKAGELFMEKNMSREAEATFNEVLKLNPNTTNIYNSLGILYRRNKQFSKAISAYEKALKIDSEDENVFFNLGRACFEAGLLKQSRQYFQKVLQIHPDLEPAVKIIEKIDSQMNAT